jgi:hypothetical protein
MIVKSKSIDKGKIFASFRYIKNIIEDKILIWGMNKTSTINSHTCVVGGVHWISAMVLVPRGEFVQLATVAPV